MHRYGFLGCALLMAASVGASTGAQETPKPVAGTWTMGGKPYQLSHVVAFPKTVRGKPGVAVLASDRPLPIDQIKRELAEEDGELSLRQPHLRVDFDAAGEAKSFYATAAGFTTNAGKTKVVGSLRRDGDKVSGEAKLESSGEGGLERSFDFKFATGLLGSGAEPAPMLAPLLKLGVTGVFKGNGKEAKLAYATALPGEPFNDKPSITLVLSEKDHSREKRPDIRVAFGDYGSALILSCHLDGSVFGCEVAHAAHEKKPFSSIGKLELLDFQIGGGQVQGSLTTRGETETFDQTWEVDVKFAAKYAGPGPSDAPAKPSPDSTASTSPGKKKGRGRPATSEPSDEPSSEPKGAPGEKLNVKQLAIVEGVEGVEYKKLVEHLSYRSETDYKTLAAELTKKLAAQGWETEGRDLIGVSAILKRKRGAAKLTIFVKPADGGSEVKAMTEGLAWD